MTLDAALITFLATPTAEEFAGDLESLQGDAHAPTWTETDLDDEVPF